MTVAVESSAIRSGRISRGHGWLAAAARYFSTWHYLHTIEGNVTARAEILEVGCGYGNAFIPSRFRATGLDINFESARSVGSFYQKAVNADASRLPFRANSFDAVASSFMLEHLPMRETQSVLDEIHKILRPGGVLICLCDLECDHPVQASLRRFYPEVYQQAFIEVPRHWGLRREDTWVELLEHPGFEITQWRLMSRFPLLDLAPFIYLASATKAPEYLRRVGRLARWVNSLGRAANVWDLVVVASDDLCRLLLPRSWAYRLLFVARKRR